jgi:hypothetical protein
MTADSILAKTWSFCIALREVGAPARFGWSVLRSLGAEMGVFGRIFAKAKNKIEVPATLARLIGMVDGNSLIASTDTLIAQPLDEIEPTHCPRGQASRAFMEPWNTTATFFQFTPKAPDRPSSPLTPHPSPLTPRPSPLTLPAAPAQR